jgi:peptidoglycan/xylan/chitin deacetylase (PgdA/CDA1 family)
MSSSLLSVATLAALTMPFLAGRNDQGITHGPEDSAMVALTFDDGLNGADTENVAEILERYEAHGTFFAVGKSLRGDAALAQRLVASGHLLANHSLTHTRADSYDVPYYELSRAQREFRVVVHACPAFYRPPFGTETRFTRSAVRRAGMRTVLWNVEVKDWAENDPARLAANVLAKVKPGAIVLLHDGTEGHPDSDRLVLLEALPAILDGLSARGLRAVRLDELLGVPGTLAGC